MRGRQISEIKLEGWEKEGWNKNMNGEGMSCKGWDREIIGK